MSRSQKTGWGVAATILGIAVTVGIFALKATFAAGETKGQVLTVERADERYVSKDRFTDLSNTVTRMDGKVDKILERMPKPYGPEQK